MEKYYILGVNNTILIQFLRVDSLSLSGWPYCTSTDLPKEDRNGKEDRAKSPLSY